MKINKGVLIGLLGAVSVVLGVIENFIPMPVPAIRLGLANVPVMIALYLTSARTAFAILILKSFLVPVFSGNLYFKLSLSLPANLGAFVVMFIVIKFLDKYSTPISAGVVGAVVHMVVQIAVAGKFYVPWLWAAHQLIGIMLFVSAVTGVLTGLLTERIINRPIFNEIFKRI